MTADVVTDPCVSVIVPMYKAEAYVDGAMQCLLHQTLREMEFIFVDDCGGDGSVGLVRQYSEQDPRIVLLSNDRNHGPGYSRNRGIEAARGKYIAFFDIDDSCDPDFYEALYRLAEKRDALICKGVLVDVYGEGERIPTRLNHDIKEGLAAGFGLYSAFVYEHSTALYQREWVMHTGARNGVNVQGEDTFFLLQVCIGADARFAFTDEACYYYLHRGSSLSGVRDKALLLNQLAGKQEKLDYINAAGLDGKSYHKFCASLLDQLTHDFIPEVLVCEAGMQLYDAYMDELGRFVSSVKEPAGMQPYIGSATGLAALHMLADEWKGMPWGKRFFVSLVRDAVPGHIATFLPRSNSLAHKLKRKLVNCVLAIIGMDRIARLNFWLYTPHR